MKPVHDPMRAPRLFHAAPIPHVEGGDLASHLIGTYGLLREWGNDAALCAAGLHHAAYGTAGFATALFDRRERALVAELLGTDVEALVYLYAACDRDYTYPRVDGRRRVVAYRDRFDGRHRELTTPEARALLELTLANELEIALRSPAFRERHRAYFADLFARAEPFLSQRGFACFISVFGRQVA